MSLPQRSSPQIMPRSSNHHQTLVPHRPTSIARQQRSLRREQNRSVQHKELAFEVSSMMAINLFISIVAIATIVKLVPYNASQHQKLQSLEAEVNALDNRVDNLRHDFTNYFDPKQSRINMRHLSDRLEPGQRKIVFSEPPKSVAAEQDTAQDTRTPIQQDVSAQRR